MFRNLSGFNLTLYRFIFNSMVYFSSKSFAKLSCDSIGLETEIYTPGKKKQGIQNVTEIDLFFSLVLLNVIRAYYKLYYLIDHCSHPFISVPSSR